MRLPNKYGSVSKLSGKRRKPYMARVTVGWELNEETGKAKQKRITIGTYKTKAEAIRALSEYTANPYDISTDKTTMNDMFERYISSTSKNVADATADGYRTTWEYCHSIYDMRVKDVRARHLKGMIENASVLRQKGRNAGVVTKASDGTKIKIKILMNHLFDFAVEYELADRNYARTFSLPKEVKERVDEKHRDHIAFTDSEMATLWANVDTCKHVDWILIQCYMGWRPGEFAGLNLSDVDLEHKCITAGLKTASGKFRTVPIHSRIFGLVERTYRYAEANGSDHFLIDLDSRMRNPEITYSKYFDRFNNVLAALGLNTDHTPHDPRKTFSTMAKKAQVDEYVVKRLMGHKINDVTERVYTDRDLEWLRSELEKIH